MQNYEGPEHGPVFSTQEITAAAFTLLTESTEEHGQPDPSTVPCVMNTQRLGGCKDFRCPGPTHGNCGYLAGPCQPRGNPEPLGV